VRTGIVRSLASAFLGDGQYGRMTVKIVDYRRMESFKIVEIA
jgi:hypothetical protein